MHSAFSAPTYAKLKDAGLEKVLKILSGFSSKVFPQFATPAIIMFKYLPRLFYNSYRAHRAKYWMLIPFLSKTSFAHANHWPQQPSVHSPCVAS